MKMNSSLKLATLAFAAMTLPVNAAHEVIASSKNPVQPVAAYEGGRGLLTMEGPSGLFINPTSGTLPAHAFTAQYCFSMPNNDTAVVWHGTMISYGVTDWLEVGAVFTAFDFDRDVTPASDIAGAGPLVRLRLLKQNGFIPQLSIGGYMRLGGIESYNAFIALYERFEISRDGFLQAIGVHAGVRESWKYKGLLDRSDAPVGYLGLEFQLPYRFYVVGEVSTQDRDSGGDFVPFSAGVQWRAGGVNLSAAFLNTGLFSEPSFYFGIGSQLKF